MDDLPFVCEDVFLDDGVSEIEYAKYRGRCREMAEALVAADPALTLVRGWYYDPAWGKQAHWWTKKPDGEIVDPTARQFPSKGQGVYEEFDGFFACQQCGKRVAEDDVYFIEPHHVYCGDRCYAIDIGMEEYVR